MPKHTLSMGAVALAAAAVLLPVKAQAEHENRYFGFGYHPFAYGPPPVAYPPYELPPGVRETAPGVYEYEVAPGRWVRFRPAYGYQPRQRARRWGEPQEALREPAPLPVPKTKPDASDDPEVVVRSVPDAEAPAHAPAQPPADLPAQAEAPLEPEAPAQSEAGSRQVAATDQGSVLSCEAAADVVKGFGFSDVQSTSCSGDTYAFDATRDGDAYSIRLSAADGELTEVRRR